VKHITFLPCPTTHAHLYKGATHTEVIQGAVVEARETLARIPQLLQLVAPRLPAATVVVAAEDMPLQNGVKVVVSPEVVEAAVAARLVRINGLCSLRI
jgi:hypothetical protein